jgi:hypothetical protein
MENEIIFYEIRGMRSLRFLVFLLFLSTPALSQKIDDGMWNAGRAFSLKMLNAGGLRLHNQLMMVQIYPGFAVVKGHYDILNSGADSIMARFKWTDTATTPHRFFQRLNNLSSAGMTVLAGSDTLALSPAADGMHFERNMPPGVTRMVTYQLTPTNQAKLSAEESVKEANGFVISFIPGQLQGNPRVFVKLMTTLTQTNLIGVYPQSATGNIQQIKWQPDSAQQAMVIWYEGAAPDYKFEKKVLPKQHLLYEDINRFDLALFDVPDFKPISKTDFTTNKKSTLGSVLYFILFSVPWLILVGFIVFLLRKPKKGKHP